MATWETIRDAAVARVKVLLPDWSEATQAQDIDRVPAGQWEKKFIVLGDGAEQTDRMTAGANGLIYVRIPFSVALIRRVQAVDRIDKIVGLQADAITVIAGFQSNGWLPTGACNLQFVRNVNEYASGGGARGVAVVQFTVEFTATIP